jgi:hypothetical protein
MNGLISALWRVLALEVSRKASSPVVHPLRGHPPVMPPTPYPWIKSERWPLNNTPAMAWPSSPARMAQSCGALFRG